MSTFLSSPQTLADIGGFLPFLIFLVVIGFKVFGAVKRNSDGDGPSTPSNDGEAAQRRRAIQEEIRRKMMEAMAERARERGQTPPQSLSGVPSASSSRPSVPPQAPLFDAVPEEEVYDDFSEMQERRRRAEEARREQEESARESVRRQSILMERLEEARQEQEASKERMLRAMNKRKSVSHAVASEQGSTRPLGHFSTDMLRHPGALRDAIVLSEILGKPVSERHGSSCAGLED